MAARCVVATGSTVAAVGGIRVRYGTIAVRVFYEECIGSTWIGRVCWS